MRSVLAAALFAAGVFVLGTAAVAWAPAGSRTALWWPAAGLSVSIVARSRRHRRSMIVIVIVASFAANLVGGRGWAVSIGFAISNGLEAAVAGWMLCRRSGRPALRELEDVWRLVGAAALGAAVIATGAATTVAIFAGGGFLSAWRLVAASHGAAVLIIAPLTMDVDARSEHGRVERVAQWVLMLGMLIIVFAPHGALPVAFVVLPFAVWGALRFSVRIVTLQLVAIAVIAVLFTAEGRGPFSPGAVSAMRNPNTTGALTQVFLISYALVLLPLAVVVAQRRSALAEISSREDMFRQGFSESLLA